MNIQLDAVRMTDSSGIKSSPHELVELIESGRRCAEEFRHDEAVEKFSQAVSNPLLSHEQRAKVRCVLAESLEYLARYRDALAIMTEYESPAGRLGLSQNALAQVWLRLGSLQGYLGDRPRAISYLKSALTIAEEQKDQEDLGACHMILGRIYQAIGETPFARDHLKIALRFHRQCGHWIPLAHNYFFLGNVCLAEGDMGTARENFEQAIKIIGDRRAPLLLGSIYTSLSNLILLQEYGQAKEGVQSLEKAIFYLKEAKNDRLLAYAYSNLGFVLKNIGEWKRAHQALQFAIETGQRVDNRAVQGTALDTLGELSMLKGDLKEAEQLLGDAITNLQAANFPYGEVQAAQTLGRCYLAQGQYQKAIQAFQSQLAIANRLEDKRSHSSAKLYLAQVQVELGNLEAAQKLLDEVAENIDSSANVSLVGHFRVVSGMLRYRNNEYEEARHEFGQAITIFFMVTDRYRESSARFQLSQVFVARGEFARAQNELKQAFDICSQLGAEPLLKRVNEALLKVNASKEQALAKPSEKPDPGTVNNAIVLRLVRAASSRELLLNELTSLLQEVTGCIPVIAFEKQDGAIMTRSICGAEWSRAESMKYQFSPKILAASSDLGGAGNPITGETIYKLRGPEDRYVIFIAAPSRGKIQRNLIEPLFRLAEMGLALNAGRGRSLSENNLDDTDAGPNLNSDGFIFASAAMRNLVSDIHKIRSSRVTALITGESGTGKEVVARLIHNLSDRRSNPFIAFNCTIASPEIVNSQLFGHKKGSFTGAVSDSVGVIRSADGGTLFLDEIGDLALEVQPKLLRFLQEGEIHRLGENTPTRVDVRVIAATNANLEKLVAEGKFREDLYYRLNIIRLQIPPLRERKEEIPLLIDHYLRLYSAQSSKLGISISPHTLDLMMVYDWPGNVRQLANEIQRLVAYKDSGEIITERDLSPMVYDARKNTEPEGKKLTSVTSALMHSSAVAADEYPIHLRFKPGEDTLGDTVDSLEQQIILESMRRHNGRRNAVCEELGITRKGLYLKLRRLPGIDLSEF